MLTIQNFEQRLNDSRVLNTFDGWTLIDYGITPEYYNMLMTCDNGTKVVAIRLYREIDMTAGDDREKVYKIEFLDSHTGYAIYEHFCTFNWLQKPPNNLLMRLGQIINEFVVTHPRFGIGPLPF